MNKSWENGGKIAIWTDCGYIGWAEPNWRKSDSVSANLTSDFIFADLYNRRKSKFSRHRLSSLIWNRFNKSWDPETCGFFSWRIFPYYSLIWFANRRFSRGKCIFSSPSAVGIIHAAYLNTMSNVVANALLWVNIRVHLFKYSLLDRTKASSLFLFSLCATKLKLKWQTSQNWWCQAIDKLFYVP